MRNFAAIGICMLALALVAHADVQQITNGGFESGLAGWTVASNAASGGSWFGDQFAFTPLTGSPTVGPASGSRYAVTDQFGPGINTISQAFVMAPGESELHLSFDMFMNDWADGIGASGENMYVELLTNGGNPITGAGAFWISNLGTTLVVGGAPNPYVHYAYELPGLVGGITYQLAFRESDTVFPMNVGLDNVSLIATPEPGSIALLGGVLAIAGIFRRFKSRA